MAGKLIFVTGGVRSGKSTFAEKLTARIGDSVTYIATAQALDDEMKHRIEVHRRRRPGSWKTVEEPLKVTDRIIENGPLCEVIMLDCLTVLISNLMFEIERQNGGEFRKEFQRDIVEVVTSLARAAKEANSHVVIVSNEVGLTLVSDNFLGRQYQEIVGLANQIVAGMADEAYLVVAGHPICLMH